MSAEHRAKRTTAEDVDVEMRHFLMRIEACVGEQPVAGRFETE